MDAVPVPISSADRAERAWLPRAGTWLLAVVVLVGIVRGLSLTLPELLRDDLSAGDAAQHTWWMYRFADPTLFPDDPAAAYFAQWFFSPPVYQYAVGGLVRLFDAQRVVETIAVGLTVAGVAGGAAVGYRIGGRASAAAAVLVLWAWHAERLAEGGFPRSLALVLLLAGTWTLLRRQWAWLGGVVLAASMLYPPAVLSLLAPAAAVMARDAWRRRPVPKAYAAFAGLALLAGVMLAVTYLPKQPADIGPPFSAGQMRRMQEWAGGGRFPFFLRDRVHYLFDSQMSGVDVPLPQTCVAAVLLALTAWRLPRAVPFEAWTLLAGSVVLWTAAHLLLFRLYFPGRYMLYALPVFAVLWAAGVAREAASRLDGRRWTHGAGAAVAVGCVGLIVLDARAARTLYDGPGKWGVGPDFNAALMYIAGLPKTTLVAAHPDDANGVPLVCRRSVLVNTEAGLPIHTAYYAGVKHRTNAAFDLLYAADWSTLDRLAKQERIDVFLLDRRRLLDPEGRPYMKPFRKGNEGRIAVGRAGGFALLTPPPERVLFTAGDWAVLKLNGGQP